VERAVQLPNGGLINPGLRADIYTHGWNPAFVGLVPARNKWLSFR
jgi:hypothetical protein